MICVAICDDETAMLEQLSRKVQNTIADAQVTTFTDGNDLLASHDENPYDIVLLDIDMPAISGMEVAKKIRDEKRNLILIFVTDFGEKVYESIIYTPFRFIRKSYIETELTEALQAAEAMIEERKRVYTFIDKSGVKEIAIKDIRYIEVVGHAAYIHTQTDTYNIRKSIKELQAELSKYDFVRPHISFLVNMEYIYGLEWDCVMLTDQQSIPLSRKNKQMVKDSLAEFLGRHN